MLRAATHIVRMSLYHSKSNAFVGRRADAAPAASFGGGATFTTRPVLSKRLTFRGFIVSDYSSQYGDFQRDVSGWIRDGKVKYREAVAEGIENTVTAFQGLLKGKNFGKQLVRMR